jgi:Flp pilus assembly pilin Flp
MRPQSNGLSSKPHSFSRPLPRRFMADDSGGASVQVALMFGAAGIAMALLAAPLVQGVAERHAATTGVDTMATGSIQPAKRYTIRRSVLHGGEETLCGGTANCLNQ